MANVIFDLSGKVAIVTGGNGGIGLGIARGLAEAGADIVVAARDQRKTEDAVSLLRGLGSHAVGVVTDVADGDSVAAAIKETLQRLGRIDILVNNAGVSIRKPPQDYSVDEWDWIVGVNLKGTFLCSRAVYPHMAQSGGGKIINIGSMTSIFGSDWVAAYAASKGGVVQLTKSLAIAWAKDNIRVNAILPGWIHTGLTANIRDQYPERYGVIKSRIPHGRWGEPYEIAGTAVYLASQASDYVTGASIPVDGGYSSF
jgi:2-deoxy-D-gluconate 3-dehydrogenase